jgi:hypothetical protein
MHSITFNNASGCHDYIIFLNKTRDDSIKQISIQPKITQQELINQEKISSINDKQILLMDEIFTELPTIKLSDGSIVTDYSKDANFASRMQQMTLSQAEAIRVQVNNNPTEFPMPCMAITANKIKNSLQQLKQQFSLITQDKQILDQVLIELNNLSPQYPYQQSLILTYKYLLYKAFLDFRFHLESLSINTKNYTELRKIYLACDENDEIMDILNYLSLSSTGRPISSMFFASCTLSKIKNLPWGALLDNSLYFLSELSNIYFSLGMNRDRNSAIVALSSNEVLIPYTNELSITFLNKTWCLPLWLVGCSLDNSLILADGFYTGASAFFEHDLFHLATKLMDLCNKQPFFLYIAEQIQLIYQHKHFIKRIKFKAIELAIFYIFHEVGLNSFQNNLITTLASFAEEFDCLPLCSLPAEYNLVSSIDMKNSFNFLTELFTNGNINIDFIKRLEIAEKNTMAQHLLDVETGLTEEYYNVNYNNPSFITETINAILYNKILLKYNSFNPSRLVSIMHKYTEIMQIKLNSKFLECSTYLQQHKLDKQVLYQLAEDQRNLDWLVCFSESDKTLTSSERCKVACRMAQKGIIVCL